MSLAGLIFYGVYWQSSDIIFALMDDSQISAEQLEILKVELLRLYIFAAASSILLFLGFYWDLNSYLKQINTQLLDALENKKLKVSFQNRSANDILGHITKHSNQLLDMFRNFDQLKSARVSLEVNTNRQLINGISEGIIFLDTDKVVTHLNHHAERFLGFSPGETVGQVILRYISDESFCNIIETALSDQKIIGKDISIYDKDYKVSGIPIKNRKGNLLRILMVISQSNAVPEPE